MYILPIIIIQSHISPMINTICYGICLFTLSSRLMMEIVQVMAEKKNYLKSFWNLNDVSLIIVFTLVAIFDLKSMYNADDAT